MNYTRKNLTDFSSENLQSDNMLIDDVSWFIGETILTGMLLEVASYPKPGLVSSVSQGAHNDMNILTFMLSSSAISSSFVLFAKAGMECRGDLESLFNSIRKTGIHFEKKLLKSTGNINTQRGILFAGGVFAAAAGYSYSVLNKHSIDDIFSTTAQMNSGISKKELNLEVLHSKKNLTAGEKLFLNYGTLGIRGEVENGFPSVRIKGLPSLYEAIQKGCRLNDCLVHSLINLMTCVEDSTILWRKGPDALAMIKESAWDILLSGSIYTEAGRDKIRRLNDICIRENISPGGSADLLTITISAYLLVNRVFNVVKM